VLFSTTITGRPALRRILRAVFSQYWRSAARPAPCPNVLVGVFTLTKIISASPIACSTSAVKRRFLPRDWRRTSCKPGSKIGGRPDCHAATRSGLMSATTTCTSGQCLAITAIVGPPT
jgi:hypothetical protein